MYYAMGLDWTVSVKVGSVYGNWLTLGWSCGRCRLFSPVSFFLCVIFMTTMENRELAFKVVFISTLDF